MFLLTISEKDKWTTLIQRRVYKEFNWKCCGKKYRRPKNWYSGSPMGHVPMGTTQGWWCVWSTPNVEILTTGGWKLTITQVYTSHVDPSTLGGVRNRYWLIIKQSLGKYTINNKTKCTSGPEGSELVKSDQVHRYWYSSREPRPHYMGPGGSRSPDHTSEPRDVKTQAQLSEGDVTEICLFIVFIMKR